MFDKPLLFVGLGNPGAEYAKTRHNAGFMAVDALHDAYSFGPWKDKFEGLLSSGKIGKYKVHLLKPQTFMNDSGRSVGPAVRFFKIPLWSLVVFHDELDLAAGKIKAKTGGGDAGHNGLRSITKHLGPDYRRVRIGVGHPQSATVVKHVLQKFSKADEEWLQPTLDAICECAPALAENDNVSFLNQMALKLNPPKHHPNPNAKQKERS